MKGDGSRILYWKYFGLNDPRVILVLRNGETMHGSLIGYCRGDLNLNESWVTSWHLHVSDEPTDLGTDAFGFPDGVFVPHADIAEVFFYEDQSRLIFNKEDKL